jgi:predicted nuclease with TOPRIM domain
MLKNKLISSINVLDQLIDITEKDIQNIKIANHEAIFSQISKKEELAKKFSMLKNEIDEILVARNKPLEEIFEEDEKELFEEFKTKLQEFHKLHKHFAKLAISVTNFYNTLMQEIKKETKISYNETANFDSKLKIKA